MNRSSIHAQENGAVPPEIITSTAQVLPLQSVLQELRVRRRVPGSSLTTSIGSALEAIWANRLRSFLTALGIFIGVASVIAALTLTQGASEYITNQLASLGTTILVLPADTSSSGVSQGSGASSSITFQDAQSLTGIAHVANISPVITVSEQVVYGKQDWSTQIEGVTTSYQAILNQQMAQGRWFSSGEDANGELVAVIGDTIVQKLFMGSGVDPVGQKIRIRDQYFRIVGVLPVQGAGFSQDDVIYIPIKAAQIRLKNTTTVDQVQVQADATENVSPIAKKITSILQHNHGIASGHRNDFSVMTFTQFLQQAGQGSLVLTALLVGIAAISLTVGGIGIMNIMLVSVTERTWEIGIRMALGARRRDIRNQFLIEAVCLCLISGGIGLLLGLLIGRVATGALGLPFVVTTTTMVLPFAVSASIALIFGLYPALRASRLDPIVAIRSDE